MEYSTEKEKKFTEIYAVFTEDIYKVCLYFTKDKGVAQEATEQTFLKFYDHFEDIPSEMYRTYLIHMAKQLALECSRKQD